MKCNNVWQNQIKKKRKNNKNKVLKINTIVSKNSMKSNFQLSKAAQYNNVNFSFRLFFPSSY